MKVFKLKVYPKGLGRSVYRVIEITEQDTLDKLCSVILESFSFDASHLYEFSLSNRCYDRDNYQYMPDEPRENSTKAKLGELNLNEEQTFLFHYDFGDDWEFPILVQEIREEEVRSIPKVLLSKGKLIQYPDWDESSDEFWDEDEEEEEELTEEQREIQKSNEQAMDLFKKSLKGLADSTIEKHLENIDFFLDEFLMYREGVDYAEGATKVTEYLGYFYIRKCLWSTPSNLKTTATSIKKFYKCMLENGKIEKHQYQEMVELIKINMEDWQEDCRRYNDFEVSDEEYFDIW